MHKFYITIALLCFGAIAVMFDTFPRSTVSQLEKRKLAQFPRFTWDRLWNGQFTNEISLWFSDSEPFRDDIMAASMTVKQWQALPKTEESITFHAAEAPVAAEQGDEAKKQAAKKKKAAEPKKKAAATDRDFEQYENRVTGDSDAKIAHAGILVLGAGQNVRAMMAFGGGANSAASFATACNKYQSILGDGVQVYSMIIPIAIEYYCPDKMRSATRPQYPVIKNCYAKLNPEVKAVNIYTTLGKHAKEDIYLRTDHHWTALGAFYAAEQFAKVAGVPFRQLDSYEQKVVHGFVGTMYGYARDAAIKDASEDFVYYTPKGLDYTTTYVNYKMDGQRVVSEMKPVKGPFFFRFKDGSHSAYLTFMSGDVKHVKVETGTQSSRRLLIVKDSFGNALPGNLFYSFGEIHVVDHRYFQHNLKQYIKDNKVTDVLIALNIFNVCNPNVSRHMVKLLEQ